MTRDEIISDIHKQGKIKQVCRNIGKHLADDLYSEIIIILIEYKNLEQLYASDYFNFFVIRTITTMFNSPRHPFFNQYRARLKEFMPQSVSINDKIKFEVDLANITRTIEDIRIEKALRKEFPFDIAIFELYLESGLSFRELSNKTKIPLPTLHRAYKNVKTEVKKRL